MITYYARNGETLDVNIAGTRFLGKVTAFLFDKIGIETPLHEPDAYLIMRVLRNYITLQKNRISLYLQELTGFEQETPETLEWVAKVALFFERSGGLIDK